MHSHSSAWALRKVERCRKGEGGEEEKSKNINLQGKLYKWREKGRGSGKEGRRKKRNEN